MRWTKADTTQYIPEKQYIDTVIIPLIPFDPGNDQQMVKQAFQRELNQVFTNLIEKEYKGRIFLAPDYHYLEGSQANETERINRWIHKFKEQPFHHIFLFTFDSKWKKYEAELEGHVLWVPGMGSGDIQSTETQSFVKEQAHQISELIQAYW
ncbi:YpiF family protein [Halobacillus sp. Nhm2S1]|uniref:YpiF family protein n=1 Tax=Halobacillus sp. Nhm2S1 TaxID=2866716 RepID=UPI001C72D421|nr:YpiF family protein [Halobacillus sp. Nhm2S1]MBX0356230.1 YpiF family protein [Halobacillus sp. Nhm2S1]